MSQPDDQVIIASVQSLGREHASNVARLTKFDPRQFKCLIIDEAHHTVAKTYLNILRHFGVTTEPAAHPGMAAVQKNNKILLWGCTATVKRSDCLALNSVFDRVTFHLPISYMIEHGWYTAQWFSQLSFHYWCRLCKPFMQACHTELEMKFEDVCSADKKEFCGDKLALYIDTDARNQLIFQNWHNIALKS